MEQSLSISFISLLFGTAPIPMFGIVLLPFTCIMHEINLTLALKF